MAAETPHPATGLDGGAAIVRTARISWLAHPPHGHGYAHVGSNAFTELPLSFRAGHADPKASSPGELLAAADASALTLILARVLERAGTPAAELVVTAEHTFVGAWYEVDSVHFRSTVRVPHASRAEIDDATLQAVEQWRLSLGLRAERSVTVESDLL